MNQSDTIECVCGIKSSSSNTYIHTIYMMHELITNATNKGAFCIVEGEQQLLNSNWDAAISDGCKPNLRSRWCFPQMRKSNFCVYLNFNYILISAADTSLWIFLLTCILYCSVIDTAASLLIKVMID